MIKINKKHARITSYKIDVNDFNTSTADFEQTCYSFGDISVDFVTHFKAMLHFYTPWKRQKTRGIEMELWLTID